jgi:predicted transcriptional regulator
MPQEIEVWYILPAIRSELAKILVKEHKLSQKKTAELLGISEGAVSQYLQAKRGKGLVLDKAVLKEIRISAERIKADKVCLMREMKRITNLAEMKQLVCKLHKGKDKDVPKYCNCPRC